MTSGSTPEKGNRRAPTRRPFSPSGVPLHAPFGALEQRELRVLAELGGKSAHVAMLIALHARTDGATGEVYDTLPKLALLAGMSLGTTRRTLRWLKDRKIVTEERHRLLGGETGTAWSWRRRALRFDLWPEEARRLSGTLGEEQRTTSASSRKSRAEHGQEALKVGNGAAHSTRHNPESYPKDFQRQNFHSENPNNEVVSPTRSVHSTALEIVEGSEGLWRDVLRILHERAISTGTLGGFVSKYASTRLEEDPGGFVVVAPNNYASNWLRDSAVEIAEILRELSGLELPPTVTFRSAK